MNQTELSKIVWDILEWRAFIILKGRKELKTIQYLLYQTQFKLSYTIQRLVKNQAQ
ncbi:hypothetical protein [cyanobacterium endosymbiont of Epithemia turgida]|uniref:hypothetical protein n=1 Tax=cyanobacterium endosymbiont of Epithemia turgida TaxID=718217 RepID=UPI0004D14E7E|nr:hypothetical protein [cyanobacterium endosymbiont of Epithemia turgida]BAP17556.1 hypothetical protein ETSB_0735 [cyanobacterium endosymbiont of Epithemia turgida isolate EtSB Lake Yunoko]